MAAKLLAFDETPILSAKLMFAVQMARVSDDLGIPVIELARMIHYAKKSARAWVNNRPKAEEFHKAAVEAIATRHGCQLCWPGLWPTVQKIGTTYSQQLPEE